MRNISDEQMYYLSSRALEVYQDSRTGTFQYVEVE